MKETNAENNPAGCPDSAAELSRRKFLARLSLTVGGIGAVIVFYSRAVF
jgi:hypothetical protein